MTFSYKIIKIDGEIKLTMIETDKKLRFQLYHQEMLVNMNV